MAATASDGRDNPAYQSRAFPALAAQDFASALGVRSKNEEQSLIARTSTDLCETQETVEARIADVEFQFNAGRFAQAKERAKIILADLLALKKNAALSLGDRKHIPYLAYFIGVCEAKLNNLPSASEAYERALSFAKEFDDKQAMADANSAIGTILESLGEYKSALVRYDDALRKTLELAGQLCKTYDVSLNERISPDKQRDLYNTVVSLSAIYTNLGNTNRMLGNYSQAKFYLESALRLKITNRNDTETPIDISRAYFQLGVLDSDKGDFEGALKLYSLAIENFPDFAKKNPLLAIVKSELGYSQFQVGALAFAWKNEKDAEIIASAALKADHPINAMVQARQATLLHLSGNPGAALPYLLKSYDIRSKAYGLKHRETLNSLSQLGSVYTALRRDTEAEEALLKVKSVYLSIKSDERRALAPFEYGRVLSRLGALGFILRRPWDQVFRDYREGIQTLSQSLGDSYHYTTEFRAELGVVEAVAALEGVGKWTSAWNNLMKGARNYLDFLSPILAAGTEREHRTVLSRQRRGLDQLLSLAEDHARELTADQVSDLFGLVLSYQAASSRIILGRNEAAFVGSNPKAKALHEELRAARRRLSHLLLSGSRELDSGNVVKDYQRIESELSRETKGYQELKLLFEAGPKELVPALPDNAALVEFVRFKRVDFRGDRQKLLKGESAQDFYAAFVLTHKGLELVQLGPAKPIDDAIAVWRDAAIDKQKQDPHGEGAVLFKLLWSPIESSLPGGIRDLRIVPDGQLSLLPFEAIRKPNGQYLVEPYLISYLSSGRNLLTPQTTGEPQGPFVIVGDPDYDALPRELPHGQIPEVPPQERLSRLPFFGVEAQLARDRLRMRFSDAEILSRLGPEATEENLSQLRGPLRLLYFVSHGSYVKEEKRPPAVPADPDNPLLVAATTAGEEGQAHSMVALAGANLSPTRVASRISDGRLTALEVEGLPIWNTDLVVLSLCESATGKIIAGEDVMGLRHAFQLAGVKTVIGSLWTVPDESTQKVMDDFLKRWLEGMPKAEALREAKLARLRDVKASSFDGQSAAPVDWAGFILHGSSR